MSTPNHDFIRAGSDTNYREAEAAFARWLVQGDEAGAMAAVAELSASAAARLAAAVRVAVQAQRMRVPATALLAALDSVCEGKEVEREWRFFPERLRQRVDETERRDGTRRSGRSE